MFNLQHVDSNTGTSFLNISPKDSVPQPSAFKFLSFERSILAECGIDRSVTPGGDPFGTGDLGNEDHPSGASTFKSTTLTLAVDITPKEFWAWEPVELDINLSVQTGKSAQPVRIPDRLDPGYSTFEVWIEEPSGERRRYRSTKHYCAGNSDLQIGTRDKFQRDISIFVESGRYTFRKAGIHRVWATFRISDRRKLQSKPIEVMVRSRHLNETRAQRRLDETRRLLTTSVRTLFYRSGFVRPREVAALEELIIRIPREHSGAAAQYALGRLFYDQMKRYPKMKKEWTHKAKPYLQAALNHAALSQNRRRRATAIVDEMVPRPRTR
jgi:hypothetical protein